MFLEKKKFFEKGLKENNLFTIETLKKGNVYKIVGTYDEKWFLDAQSLLDYPDVIVLSAEEFLEYCIIRTDYDYVFGCNKGVEFKGPNGVEVVGSENSMKHSKAEYPVLALTTPEKVEVLNEIGAKDEAIHVDLFLFETGEKVTELLLPGEIIIFFKEVK